MSAWIGSDMNALTLTGLLLLLKIYAAVQWPTRLYVTCNNACSNALTQEKSVA